MRYNCTPYCHIIADAFAGLVLSARRYDIGAACDEMKDKKMLNNSRFGEG